MVDYWLFRLPKGDTFVELTAGTRSPFTAMTMAMAKSQPVHPRGEIQGWLKTRGVSITPYGAQNNGGGKKTVSTFRCTKEDAVLLKLFYG